jgi:DNA-binding IclR family transcriptional regulator
VTFTSTPRPPGAITLRPSELATLRAVLAGADHLAAIAATVAYSRSTVHDAVCRLADLGLVTFTPRLHHTIRPAVSVVR